MIENKMKLKININLKEKNNKINGIDKIYLFLLLKLN